MFIASGALVLAVAAGLLLRNPTPASATPSFLGLAEAQYPSIVGSRIDTCTLCHMSTGSPSGSNLNSYGTAFLNNGLNAAALVAIENLDSDGDGFANIQEISALTFPGDPNDHPQAATATSVPTAVPTTAPTLPPTSVPTTAPTNTTTNVPTIAPTIVPTTFPSATVVPTEEASLTPLPTGTVSPTETLTPLPTGTVIATTAAQCQESDENNEHFKKSHGKSAEQMAADEEANEEKVCKTHGEGSEVEEAHESAQAELHEHENQGSEGNVGEQENSNQQDSSGQEGNDNQQESLTKEQYSPARSTCG